MEERLSKKKSKPSTYCTGRSNQRVRRVRTRPSALAARENAMVVNLEFIKAIVIAEEVLLLDPLRHEVLPFVDQLRQKLPDRSQVKRYPMEFEKQSDWFTCTCTKDL